MSSLLSLYVSRATEWDLQTNEEFLFTVCYESIQYPTGMSNNGLSVGNGWCFKNIY